MEIGENYKAKLIDNRWVVVVGKQETIVCTVKAYFTEEEGIAKGIAVALNTSERIKLNVSI